MNSIVEVKNLSFSIERKKILNDVSFRVEPGEHMSIVGPNGAGKSTLLKCLNRIQTGFMGTILLKGKELSSYHQRELAQIVAYVPQSDGYAAPFTVREFVFMGRYPFRKSIFSFSSSDQKVVQEALEATRTIEFVDRPISSLSGGERQKVFIAAAIAQEADILLLDEPTTFLDPRHMSEINSLLLNIKKDKGTTVITVTHDINNAALTSHHILALREGFIKYWGGPESFMDNACLSQVYGKDFVFMNHPQSGERIVAPEGARF